MFVASATDFAIAQAIVSGTIRVTLRQSRLGGQFAAIALLRSAHRQDRPACRKLSLDDRVRHRDVVDGRARRAGRRRYRLLLPRGAPSLSDVR